MSEILLFTVEETSKLSGRPGLVLVPGIPNKTGLPSIRIGAPIFIVTPNGDRIDTQIAGVEMINYGRRPLPENPSVPIGLPSSVSKTQIPLGSKVYLASTGGDRAGA
ncbi:hypothetical protein [Lysobacter sp. cf310]|uniref:hypothetical protein n=1 Tax=Lysobacter sp. cf310 TaxID=1761790 RepID=UPI001113F0DD|nr:hypothetical protein [Lysobacter sp. cf310]